MGGQNSSYHPTSKPPKDHHHNSAAFSLRKKPYIFALVVLLCALSYLLGASRSPSNRPDPNPTRPTPTQPQLNFAARHTAADTGPGLEPGLGPGQAYGPCGVNASEYTPCEDHARSLGFKRDRLVYRERHCPVEADRRKCRVPAPHGYRNPFRWPVSREYAWYNNVPHKELTVEKAVQNWIRFEGDRFRFPGGGTMFPNGADAYIDDIAKLINLDDGSIRTAIDTGCGVASWGAYLLSRNILAMSFAPRDSHEAQVQFALERGVPALIGVMASKRLPYPSRAFDMAHCSRCLIPWDQFDGQYLIEVDRVLRPGGYWILSGPPIRWKKYWKGWNRSKEDLNEEQTRIENVAKSLCWSKVIEKGDIAIWQKPINHFNCKSSPKVKSTHPPFCSSQDPDFAWYTNLETCLTPLPQVTNKQEFGGGKLPKWPQRLNATPPRIKSGSIKGITKEIFQENTKLWEKRVSYYKLVNNQLGQQGRYRNILDMNANLGGFAASLVDDPLWVMNVVPVEARVNTLGVVYERGLIGTYQNWCEAMSTYPRTYDLIHADSIFTLYKDRCEMDDILLEMDRILRPEGSVIFRDDVDVLVQIKKIIDEFNWDSQIVDHENGPLEREKLLFAVKNYWTAPKIDDQSGPNHST